MTTQTRSMLPHEDMTLGEEVGFKNPRSTTGLKPKDIAELADDIEQRGLQDEIVIWPREVDKVTYNVVIRGQRRYLAIGKLIVEGRANGLSKGIPVKYATCETVAEAEALALIDVVQGEGLSTVELAEAIERQRDGGKSGKQIAKSLGKSETWVSRIGGAYHKATPELREAWKAGKVPDESAKQLADVPKEQQAEAVKEFVETRAETPTRKAKAKTRAAVVKEKPKKKAKAEAKSTRRDTSEVEDLLETLDKLIDVKAEATLEGMRAALQWALGKYEAKGLPKVFHDALKKVEDEEAKKLKLGDAVRWKSQANGRWKTKEGKVVEVVPVGKLPREVAHSGVRKWTSFVIETSDGVRYYPVPGTLERL